MQSWEDDFEMEFEEDNMVTISGSDEEDTVVTVFREEPDEGENQPTISSFSLMDQTEPVTGWLVCIEGEEKGKAYQLGFGTNRIGRSPDMDVCLMDARVVWERHAAVIYEDRRNLFYVAPGRGVVRLQGELLKEPRQLQEDMVIGIGKGSYRFVPYCNERRNWK